MTVVAVAGGLGDLGRLIVDALLETDKYEVYIMSRKAIHSLRELFHVVDNVDTDRAGQRRPHLAIDWQTLPALYPDRLLRRFPGRATHRKACQRCHLYLHHGLRSRVRRAATAYPRRRPVPQRPALHPLRIQRRVRCR